MLRKLTLGLCLSACVLATVSNAQDRPAPKPGAAESAYLPSQAQWDNMNAKGKAFVAKAKAQAGNDNDLKFDFSIFCQANGGASNKARATLGAPPGAPYAAFPAPEKITVMPPQRLFDNMWWFGDTHVGVYVFTSNDGYIMVDAMDNAAEARDIVVGGMKKVGLDPAKIKYVIYGHWHGDHTGGGHYIETNYHPRAIMGRDDWDLYYKMLADASKGKGQGSASRLDDKVPMKHDIDAVDGMKIKVGDLTGTVYQMTGHTPGSIGMIIPVKWGGKEHPILIVTAGTDVHNRDALIGGYEHIWDAGLNAKVESVFQVHPNTNVNTLGRVKYVNDNFDSMVKSGNNPLLYGVDKTRKNIEIMRNCTLARLQALGW